MSAVLPGSISSAVESYGLGLHPHTTAAIGLSHHLQRGRITETTFMIPRRMTTPTHAAWPPDRPTAKLMC